MGFKHLVLESAAVSLLALAACGGDGADTEDFIAEADQICTEAERERVDIALGRPILKTSEQEAAVLREIVPVHQREHDDLAALEPPEDASTEYSDFLAARADVVAAGEERRALAERGAPAEERLAASDRAEAANDRADEPAAAIGLEACAHRLPPEQVEEITANTEDVFTSEDPAVCTELLTDVFLERFDQTLEQCKRQQQKERGTELIELSDVEGIAGVSATARMEAQGGPRVAPPTEVTYVYQDGTWKLTNFTEAPPAE